MPTSFLGAIGARTTESQTHRELASGLSCPVGFQERHGRGYPGGGRRYQVGLPAPSFLSVTSRPLRHFQTAGNEDCHVIPRGGKHPNYDMFQWTTPVRCWRKRAGGTYHDRCQSRQQPQDPALARSTWPVMLPPGSPGSRSIFGPMLESNLVEGARTWSPGGR